MPASEGLRRHLYVGVREGVSVRFSDYGSLPLHLLDKFTFSQFEFRKAWRGEPSGVRTPKCRSIVHAALSDPTSSDLNPYAGDSESDPTSHSDSSQLLSISTTTDPPEFGSSPAVASSQSATKTEEYGDCESNTKTASPPGLQPVFAGMGRDSLVVLASQLLAEASRGLVLPTISWLKIRPILAQRFTYVTLNGGSIKELGISVSLFSAGRLVVTAPFGYWAERRGSREVLLFAAFFAALGNTLYSLSHALPFPLFFLCASRLIVGIGCGVMGVGRAYVATASTLEDRTRAMAFWGMAQYAGFSLSPGLAMLLMWLEGAYSARAADASTAGSPTLVACIIPGVALVILNVCLIPILLFGMPHRYTIASPAGVQASASIPLLPVVSNFALATPAPDPRLLQYGLILFFALNFILRGVIGVTETTAPETFAWLTEGQEGAIEQSGRFFFILGILGLGMFLLVDPITRRLMPPHILLVAGTILIAAGILMNLDPKPTQTAASHAQFTAGMVMIWSIGSPICSTLTVSSFSKMLGSRPQGSAMSWITVAGSLGRIVFPAMVGLGNSAAVYVNLFDVVADLLKRLPPGRTLGLESAAVSPQVREGECLS
ncbi:major facilitator superfamily domain-containing protein [Blyttiomyces helicus]|uniref:Major facilitator superfamily domain-containing protein n=1 Tax=Blyttiomyces helicus TaxID=388810 RepID=A0A4P9W6F3_9FUNG|nr:major facilitator superfamily domain-containing protein [Blyttiomyces helicus]|eukprot:RKO87894.1 major facilitator superfamily domain-containing protein [Blyttiomyces helicus]